MWVLLLFHISQRFLVHPQLPTFKIENLNQIYIKLPRSLLTFEVTNHTFLYTVLYK